MAFTLFFYLLRNPFTSVLSYASLVAIIVLSIKLLALFIPILSFFLLTGMFDLWECRNHKEKASDFKTGNIYSVTVTSQNSTPAARTYYSFSLFRN